MGMIFSSTDAFFPPILMRAGPTGYMLFILTLLAFKVGYGQVIMDPSWKKAHTLLRISHCVGKKRCRERKGSQRNVGQMEGKEADKEQAHPFLGAYNPSPRLDGTAPGGLIIESLSYPLQHVE